MINSQLINPKSIVIVGGSNDVRKPGGKVLKNIIDGNYRGKLLVVNPKEEDVQGIQSYKNIETLPEVELAILAIASKYCLEAVDLLANKKNTKAFIILSAGFSEDSEEGAEIEKRIVDIINKIGGCLIGPNCIGVLTPYYQGVFTEPNPKLEVTGIDFVSGSGATAVFILNSAIPQGVRFASLYSVGNSAQIGIEEVVKYWDESFDLQKSAKVKILYMESIEKPEMLLKHATSLIQKGCKIAAIKAGASDAGSRAASSHTGAMASSDLAVDALLKKAGIVRCFGREELIRTATILTHKELKGNNFAIITHAGGPAVMLTDVLSKNGLNVPEIDKTLSKPLLDKLFHGSSVANPIDFLATGTAEQLDLIIDFVENQITHVDGIIIIYGKTGLSDIYDVLNVIDNKMKTSEKPIYTVFPTTVVAQEEMEYFNSLGRDFFMDEVTLGDSLAKIYHTPPPQPLTGFPEINKKGIRSVIENATNGYISPVEIQKLFDAANIPRVHEGVADNTEEAIKIANKINYPLVMKVVGPVHKTDVNGVVLNVASEAQMIEEFNRMIKIKDTRAVLMQPMLTGTELFIGAKYEDNFGHVILCGLGGIFIEVLKDIAFALTPLSKNETIQMIRSLKSYKIIQGTRGKKGINEDTFAEILVNLSAMLWICPEIKELDINPLMADENKIIAVDARIRIEK